MYTLDHNSTLSPTLSPSTSPNKSPTKKVCITSHPVTVFLFNYSLDLTELNLLYTANQESHKISKSRPFPIAVSKLFSYIYYIASTCCHAHIDCTCLNHISTLSPTLSPSNSPRMSPNTSPTKKVYFKWLLLFCSFAHWPLMHTLVTTLILLQPTRRPTKFPTLEPTLSP